MPKEPLSELANEALLELLSDEEKARMIDGFLFQSGTGGKRPTPAQVTSGLTWLKKHGFYTEKSQVTLIALTADRISQARQEAIQRVNDFHAELAQGGTELPTESLVEANRVEQNDNGTNREDKPST